MRRQVLREPTVQVIFRLPANLLEKLEAAAKKPKPPTTKQAVGIQIMADYFGIRVELPKMGRPWPAKKRAAKKKPG